MGIKKERALTPKKLDQTISALWGRYGHGVQINITDIPALFRDARAYYVRRGCATSALDHIVRALASKYRVANPDRTAELAIGGHVATRQGDAYECTRCGASGSHASGGVAFDHDCQSAFILAVSNLHNQAYLSLKTAQDGYNQLRDTWLRDDSASGAWNGVATFPEGKITTWLHNTHATEYRVSYNGRIWNGDAEVLP
jgi:hypothetical protein